MNIPQLVAHLINEDADYVRDFASAVAVASYGRKWLLGMAKKSDGRSWKWSFPAGHIKDGETAEQAACRECLEETNASCRSLAKAFTLPDRPGIAFVPCRITSRPKFKMNGEFVALGLFSVAEIRKLGKKVYDNVLELIQHASAH